MGEVGAGTHADFEHSAFGQSHHLLAKLEDRPRIPQSAYETGIDVVLVKGHSQS